MKLLNLFKKKDKPKKKKLCRLRGFLGKHRLLIGFFALVTAALMLEGGIAVLVINGGIKNAVDENILTPDALESVGEVDCILVLGCGVKPDGTPSDMLYDRIRTACELYHAGYADKILFSGDHGQAHYDEVGAMLRVASEEFGIPLQDIFLDHAGFSTYETTARAAEVFGVEKAIVVTQEYHLYRALYLAESYGIEAYGVSASIRSYRGQSMRDLREVAARCKDLLSALFKPDFVGGAPIDITGDGRLTHD